MKPPVTMSAANAIPPTVDPAIIGVLSWLLEEEIGGVVAGAVEVRSEVGVEVSDEVGVEVSVEVGVEVEVVSNDEVVEAEMLAGSVKVPPWARQ